MATSRLFIHHPEAREPEVIDEIIETMTLREVITRRLGVTDRTVTLVEDTEIELSDELTVLEAEIADDAHLHVARRNKVHVEIGYLGDTRSQDVSPAVTIRKIRKWALGPEGFDLPPDQRAKHVLVLAGTQDRPTPETHVGSLVDEDHRVRLELVSKHQVAG
jgi:hypothetical protein